MTIKMTTQMKMQHQKLSPVLVEKLVRAALEEDLGRGGDITSDAVIPVDATASVAMVARDDGRICGLDLAEMSFRLADDTLSVKRIFPDGSDVKAGDTVMTVSGSARGILLGERTALNFVGRLSGIATMTRDMQAMVGNYKARIAATRKTTPLLRAIEKYAVVVGGGAPHRYGLDDAVMIKDNHIAMAGGIAVALQRAKQSVGHTVKIEIEVDTLDQLDDVLQEGADIILLDNMSTADMAEAVKRTAGRAILEASGNVTKERIAEIAATGVDMISCGALTHSVRNFDVGLDFKTAA